ncbi:hypothetical protein F442_11110 [Phytophthora nicotianae P10297]|uniref:Uncharacterized protein n=1 Tax=Phytophthora nicotianae P10297 TaxID=1317064 RepID=W2Z3T8_PHYNI|nr:hypothetical protein F442_11110 [Phytophthora nicotianae P10297]
MWRKEAKKSGESHRSHTNVARDSQQQPPLANSNDAQTAYPLLRNNQMDTTPIVSQGASHNERSTTANTAPAAPSRSGGDRNWSARIRASIARLMDIDGVSLNPERFANLTLENQAAKEAQQAFRERVDRLQVASEAAHKEHWKRLRDVYPASTTKKMRFTIADHPSPSATTMISSSATPASYQPRHAALDALVVAAATEDLTKSLTPANAKRARHRHNLLSLRNGAGAEQSPVRVHDPQLAKAVNNLADKLARLLGQLQATSDEATAEPILAAAATIALEATEMRRNEEVALARMVEIEEHRQHIMQGLLEYEMRKEQREKDESSKECTATLSGSHGSQKDSGAKVDERQD